MFQLSFCLTCWVHQVAIFVYDNYLKKVDQDHIRKSTEKLNAKFKVENPILLEEVNKQKSDNQETDYQDLDDEEFEEMLRRLEKEKSRRKHKEKDFEM